LRGICTGDASRLLDKAVIVVEVGVPGFASAQEDVQFVKLNCLLELSERLKK
jgi:hypothetical protein